jgi:hypothetical protein
MCNCQKRKENPIFIHQKDRFFPLSGYGTLTCTKQNQNIIRRENKTLVAQIYVQEHNFRNVNRLSRDYTKNHAPSFCLSLSSWDILVRGIFLVHGANDPLKINKEMMSQNKCIMQTRTMPNSLESTS